MNARLRLGLLLGTASILCGAVKAPAQSTATMTESWSPRLQQLATQLVQDGDIRFTGDVVCEIGDGNGVAYPAHAGSDAIALLRVASQQDIFLYAHGFYRLNPRRQRPPATYAFDTWSLHLDRARATGAPMSACLLLSDTSVGFGVRQSTLGDLLFALRTLTDDPELYSAKRHIRLIGYSAGANYIKQGLVTFREHLQVNALPPAGMKRTKMTAVFLGAPHNGTDWASIVSAGVELGNQLLAMAPSTARRYEDYHRARMATWERAEVEAMTGSRGARQLQRGNPELEALNRQFRDAMPPNLTIINLFGSADMVAPASSSALTYLRSEVLDQFSHADFVAPISNIKAGTLMDRLYPRSTP